MLVTVDVFVLVENVVTVEVFVVKPPTLITGNVFVCEVKTVSVVIGEERATVVVTTDPETETLTVTGVV